jgi:uncharacterized protein
MPEYLSPGVYVEEINVGPRPIEGVSTSTAAVVGEAERGLMTPRLVTSWSDYQRWYGGYLDPPNRSYLPWAVKGFFDNGGQRIFVARVAGAGAAAATFSLAAPSGTVPPADTNVLTATAAGEGAWGNRLLISVSPGTQADLAALVPRDFFRIQVLYYRDGIPDPFVDPFDLANLANPFRREPDVAEDYDNLSADENATNYVLTVVNSRSRLVELAYANTAGGAGVPARPADVGFSRTSELDLPMNDGVTSLHLAAAGPGGWGNAITVTGTVAGTTFTVQVQGFNRNEVYSNLTARTVLATINGASRLVRARWEPPAPPPAAASLLVATPVPAPALQNGADLRFGGGNDGAAITPLQFAGRATDPIDRRRGLAGLEAIDEISMLMAPDEVNGAIANNFQITNLLVDQCERLKDRFAILSIAENEGNVATILPPRDSTYGAVYYPWIRVLEPRSQDTLLIPPAGHVAGIYARTDVERGVHKAPANEVVRGIVTVDLSNNRKPLRYTITKGEHDILNPRGVNVIRDFRSDRRGIRVWGARTMSSDMMWKYVNVRRLFLFVEESIDEGMQWVVFEPNDDTTWSAVRRSVSNFLIRVWRSGGLMGATEEEAFFVKCDRTTMTQDDIDNGRLICLIGIAPVKPAEFVIFRISQKTADAAS